MAKKRPGSSVDDMVLVPVDRRRRRRLRVYGSLFVVLAVLAAFVAGQVSVRENTSRMERDRARLATEVTRLDTALRAARNELALHRTGTEVSQQAQEQVRSEIRDLRGQLAELEEAHAMAVRGAYLEGDSYQELADNAGVPINTMRTWLRRSLVKLKDCLSR